MVLDAILHGQHGLVLEEALEVSLYLPSVTMPGERHVVAAHVVACCVGIRTICDITSAAQQSVHVGAESSGMLQVISQLGIHVVSLASKLGTQLKADVESQGKCAVLLAEFPVESLLVVHRVVCIASHEIGNIVSKVLLPLAIGQHSIGSPHLPFPPALRSRECEVVDVYTNLRNRTGIDAQAESTTGECLVAQQDRMFLGTYDQVGLLVTKLYEGLLNHKGSG